VSIRPILHLISRFGTLRPIQAEPEPKAANR
jgi:hypothetical protein